MIFFNIIIFFVSIILFSVSIAGYGSLIRLKNENDFFIDIFLGFTIISFIVTIFHFFLLLEVLSFKLIIPMQEVINL